MAFGDLTGNFRNGICLDPKHATTRCTDHEKTDYHLRAAQAYIKHCGMMTVSSLLTNEQEKLRLTNVLRNREVMKRLINWILCIGRQGMAYRGDFESTKYFNDDSKNHGNFLEILRTASQQDELLKQHLDKCAKASQQEPDKKGPKGRGSKITFISKTTINKIIHEIGVQMKTKNVNEINSVDFYSIMVDSTQDITAYEQCSIFVRYVNRTTQKIEERLIGVLRLMDTSGEGYFHAIVEYLQKLGIDPLKMVGCSFDGASNMRSDDIGLQGRLKQIIPNLVFTWCYCHKLNLCVCTSISCILSAKNVFGLLQTTHTFCSESYKRTLEWEKSTDRLKGREKLIRFEHLGKTRWYSNDKSLTKIFGSYHEQKTSIFESLLKFLHNVKVGKTFDSKTSYEAAALLGNWTKMENLITAFVFLKIFDILGPLSKYLQTTGLDIHVAQTMIKSAISRIGKVRNSFNEIKEKAIKFAKTVNNNIDIDDVSMEEEIPNRRVRRVKRMPGEKCVDERIESAWENYRVNQFLVICDQTTQALNDRFASKENEDLMKEMAYFNPRLFNVLSTENTLSFPFLSKTLNIKEENLFRELQDFADNFTKLKKLDDLTYFTERIDQPETSVESEDEYLDSDEDDGETVKCVTKKKACNSCVKCCFLMISKFNLHSSAYSNLYRVYEYIMTLPCTQVACERCFSKLKNIKSRLRSAIKQCLLEALIFMNVERELTFALDVDDIINAIGLSSKELARQLIE